MNSIHCKAYAKINLGLDVVRRREDGYHEVRMIMQTIHLYDKLNIKKAENARGKKDIYLKTNLPFLPVNENNLVYKAVRLLKDEFQIDTPIAIYLDKHIPVAAGMAGGSTDCAAALKAMNSLFDLGLTTEELMERGVKLGADVPYCILGGTALSEGIGEILTPLPPMPACKVLVVKPSMYVSTKTVYENLNLPGLTSHPDIDAMIQAIEHNDLYQIAQKLENVLESVTLKEYPVLSKIKTTMKENGALGALMSGSGPTVFGLFDDEALANQAFSACKKIDRSNRVFLVEPSNTTILET